MTTPRGDVDAALAGLQARWGAAAPRVVGALALAPMPAEVDEAPDARPSIAPAGDDRVIHTGFAALDAILGPGGLPRSASVAIRGDGSSGRTTLALRTAAEAQTAGSVVAWLDLSRSFDPVEALSRGVRLELARRSWVRLGRDVVGQCTEALVAHDRYGPPGRRATLRILYAEGGERDACLTHDAPWATRAGSPVILISFSANESRLHRCSEQRDPATRSRPLQAYSRDRNRRFQWPATALQP